MRKREPQRVERLKSAASEQRLPEESADLLAAWLQRSVSNSAVARLLARDEAPTKEKPKATALDAKAQAIVDAAQDSKQDIATRAVQSVKSIISTYYSADADLVKEVAYVKSEPGLNTEVATGKNVKGKIEVGDYFVNNTTKKGLARRVIQVDHELEHVRQHRAGMGGPKTKNLREFLAYHREALAPELPGTGKVSHATRVDLIDAALKNYTGMSEDQKKAQAGKKDELLKIRPDHVKKSGKTFPEPPVK